MDFYQGPFRFYGTEAPIIYDKHGKPVVILMLPESPAGQEEAALKEAQRVGQLIQDTFNRVALSEELLKPPKAK